MLHFAGKYTSCGSSGTLVSRVNEHELCIASTYPSSIQGEVSGQIFNGMTYGREGRSLRGPERVARSNGQADELVCLASCGRLK